MTCKQVASEVVDGVVVVDWTKGPADAGFYTPETESSFETFLKIEGNRVYVIHMKNDENPRWRPAFFDTVEDVLADKVVIKKESK